MEIVKTKIEVKVFGKEFSLKPPTARQSAELKKSLNDCKDNDVEMVEKATSFLMASGLDKEVCDELELDHLIKLIEFITTKKK